LVQGWYGMTQVKWLRQITVLDRAFDGYQNATAYRLIRDAETGEPVTRIEPRALMMPPGFPDFMSRVRVVADCRRRRQHRLRAHLATGRAGPGARWVVLAQLEFPLGGNNSGRT